MTAPTKSVWLKIKHGLKLCMDEQLYPTLRVDIVSCPYPKLNAGLAYIVW